jgi:hypothetical protein
MSISLKQGWNTVSVDHDVTAAVLNVDTVVSLWRWDTGEQSYRMVAADETLTAGTGYWAYALEATLIKLPAAAQVALLPQVRTETVVTEQAEPLPKRSVLVAVTVELVTESVLTEDDETVGQFVAEQTEADGVQAVSENALADAIEAVAAALRR